MDSESQQLFHEYHSEHPSAQCIVCRMHYFPRTGGNEVSESVTICRECKSLVADDNEATPPVRNFRDQRRQQRGRTIRHGSSESIDDLISQHFSQLIGLVRQQNHEITQGDDRDATGPSNSPARNWPRSLQRTLSDDDIESLDHGDSVSGESDSNVNYDGEDSEISEDTFYTLLGREILARQDHESQFYIATDIDPMSAGLDQWNSDEDEDEDVEWGEVNVGEASVPSVLPVFGNSRDYLDERGFEELLEWFAENDDSRRGAPPASVSAIGSIPRVIISKKHEKNGCLACAVCKDPLPVGTEAKQLPCLHLYHPVCILPWLNARNSCPICRYELPTDDPEYEEGRRNVGGSTVIYDIQRLNQTENLSGNGDHVRNEGGDSVTAGSNRRWYFIGAAPIVSIVGIALALWFRNSMGERTLCGVGDRDLQQPRRSHCTSVATERSKRWWSFF